MRVCLFGWRGGNEIAGGRDERGQGVMFGLVHMCSLLFVLCMFWGVRCWELCCLSVLQLVHPPWYIDALLVRYLLFDSHDARSVGT